MQTLQSGFGLAVMLFLAWILSEQRRAVPWRLVVSGLALAFTLALALLSVPPLAGLLASLNQALAVLESALQAGTSFVFGYLGGGEAPYPVPDSAAGFVLASRALPLMLLVAALSALLFHWGILPLVVRAFAWVLKRSVGGLTALLPAERRSELAQLGMKSVGAGLLATCATAAIVGMLV